MQTAVWFQRSLPIKYLRKGAYSIYENYEVIEREFQRIRDNTGTRHIIIGQDERELIELAGKYFSSISVHADEREGKMKWDVEKILYRIDEPDVRMSIEELNALVEKHKKADARLIVNFVDSTWVKKYLDRYDNLDCISFDYYPVRVYKSPCRHIAHSGRELHRDMKGFEEELHLFRKVADKRPLWIFLQAFAKPDIWRYPSVPEFEKMIKLCRDEGVDCVQFFLWTSIYTGTEFLCGMDVLPPRYHEIVRECGN